MYYRLRYMILGGINLGFFIFIYFYDIQLLQNQIAFHGLEEKNLYERWIEIKSSIRLRDATFSRINKNHISAVKKNEREIIHDLVLKAHIYKLVVRKIKWQPLQVKNSPPIFLLQIVLEGNFENTHSFLSALDKLSYTIIIKNFSFKWDGKEHLLSKFDLLTSQSMNDFKIINKTTKSTNPFCYLHNNYYQNYLLEMRAFSLFEMRMVGYLQKGNRREAFILLPNHAVVSVKPGDFLGNESAVVGKIFYDHVSVKLKNHSYVIQEAV